MSSANGATFRVSWSQAQRVIAAGLGQRAKALGILPQFVAEIDEMDGRLKLDPTNWGDPQFDYHYLGLVVYHATLNLIHVYYAVDKQRRIVYIKEISAMPSRPLEE